MYYVLDKVVRYTKNKEGKPLVRSDGKPYTRIGIQIDDEQYKGQWIYGFDDWKTKDFKEGSSVNIIITKNDGFTNFKVPGKTDLLEQRVEVLEKDVIALKEFMTSQDGKEKEEEKLVIDEEYPEVDPKDIPF